MKKFMEEFKAFAVKGNMIDMAIGVIIGGAFTALVTAFTGNIVNPLLALVPGVNSLEDSLKIVLKKAEMSPAGEVIAEEVAIKIGAFIAAIVTFLILAMIVFLIMKSINKLRTKEEAAPPTTKTCPFCKSEISLEAVRCPHCTSQLPEGE